MRGVLHGFGNRFGIAWRLTLAFLGVGALTIIACIVGWLSYDRFTEDLNAINRVHLPTAAFAARLAEQGGAVIATAPVLALARTEEEYKSAKEGLDNRLVAMRKVLADIRNSSAPSPAVGLSTDVDEIERNLNSLDKTVRDRLQLVAKNRQMVEQLRWLHADFLEDAQPLIDDSRFVIRSTLAEMERNNTRSSDDFRRLKAELARTETMTALNAQTNLAVGLISRVAVLSTLEDLTQTMYFLAETVDAVRPELVTLSNVSDAVTLRQVIAKIIELSTIENGIPGVRRAEILSADQAQRLLVQNRKLVEKMSESISSYVLEANEGAINAARRSTAAISVGRDLLLFLAIVSMMAVGAGVLYVDRNLVSRIVSLASAARALERGDVATPIPLSGHDELSDMAYALKRFRDTQEEFVQAAKLAALGELVAGISHELNQPLAAIRSHAHSGKILISRGKASEATATFSRIENLTVKMAETVSHLKRFARKPEGRCVPVPLRATVQGALELFGPSFKTDKIAVVMSVDPAITVLAEEVRLEQIFVNLVSNSLDAMKGSDNPVLTISASQREDEVDVIVHDTGHGIPEDAVPSIFDPFMTTKPVGAGLGLGLSMSYNIAKDFGGLLTLAGNDSGSTTFKLSLKRADG